MLQAARQFHALRLGAPILLGDTAKIKEVAEGLNISLEGIRIINPAESEDLDNFVKRFHRLRREKGLRATEAREAMLQPNYYGAMMVAMHQADGLISGTSQITGSVLRPLFQIIKVAPRHHDGFQLHGDGSRGHALRRRRRVVHGGLRRDSRTERGPTRGHRGFHRATRAAHAGHATARGVALVFHQGQRHASVHRQGAGRHGAWRSKRRQQLNLEADFDGELQVDAALVPEIAARKLPESKVAGRANVLIFPDLNSGNIASKLVQHVGRANAYGQILLGLDRPAADVSRGSNAHDILGVAAIVGVQSIEYQKLYPGGVRARQSCRGE